MSEDGHPLSGDEIVTHYSHDSISRASRNSRVLVWLVRQPEETQANIRALYAGHIGCDIEEVLALNGKEDLDDDTLLFVYSLFSTQIDRP